MVTSGIRQQTTRFRPRGLGTSAALLSAVVGAGYVLLSPFIYRLHGADGLSAAGVAAFVCWTGAIGGMLTSRWLHGPSHLLAGMLLGMALRMALPLIVCMVVYLRGGALAEAGFVFYVLAFYLMTLAIDTWMATGRAAGAGPTSEDS